MRRFASFIMYVLLGLPAAFSALFLIGAKPWASDREFYRKALTDDRLYAVVSSAQPGMTDGTMEIGATRFDDDGILAAARAVLPVPELKSLASAGVDELFDSTARGGDRVVDLDLVPLKKALASGVDAAARAYVDALPVRDEPAIPDDLSFRPASVTPAAMQRQVRTGLSAAVASIPDRYSGSLETERQETIAPGGMLLSRTLLGISPALAAVAALALIGLSAAVGRRRPGEMLKAAGSRTIFPSAIVMIAGGLLYLPGGLLLKGPLRAGLPAGSEAFLTPSGAAEVASYLAQVLGPPARSLFLTGLAGTSIGAALIASRRIPESRQITDDE